MSLTAGCERGKRSAWTCSLASARALSRLDLGATTPEPRSGDHKGVVAARGALSYNRGSLSRSAREFAT